VNSDYDTSDPVVVQLYKARTELVYLNQLLGEVAFGIDLVILEKPDWCPRAATDGTTIYFYRGFIISLFHDANIPEKRLNGHNRLIAILAHEIWHKLWDHLIRRGNRDPDYWNMAVDYIVNATIKEDKIGLLPKDALLSPLFTTQHTAEQVHDYLVDSNAPKQESLDQHIEPASSSNDEQDAGDIMKETAAAASARQPANGGIRVEQGDVRPAPPSMEEARQEAARCRMVAIRAALSGGAGMLPAGLHRELVDLIDAKMDWRALLNNSMRSIEPSNYSYEELSDVTWASWIYHRRRWTPDCGYKKGYCAILPAQTPGERVECVIALDTSASMTNRMISEILAEIGSIFETFDEVRVVILCFDGTVHSENVFTKHTMADFTSFKRAKVVGGGGTNFGSVFDYLKKNRIKPDRLVICTDGQPSGTWGDPQYCNTIFAIYDKKRTIRAPFGKTVYLD